MAEALGIASSIAGLITIADIIVRKGYKFLKDAKDAEKAVKQLVDEVNGLSGVLHSLNNVVERLEEDSIGFDPSTQIHYVESCFQTLVKLQGCFDKALPSVPMSRMERLIWPLKQSQTKELLQDVDRHKTTMLLAMSATEMSTLLQILSRQDKFKDGLDLMIAGLEDDRMERKTIMLNVARHKMLDFLGQFDPGKWQETNIRLRQPGTGIWFTDGPDLKSWLSNARSCLWVYGIPGAGKTVLMASTIQEIQKLANADTASAFFFCDYKYPETHDALTILGSLARQLVVQHEDCFVDLEEFHHQHVNLDRTMRAPHTEELCAFIIKLSSHFQTTMIVVDGLDEISQDRAGVTKLLRTLNCSSSMVKILFASRPEIDIRDELEDFTSISIAAQSSDLRLYVAAEIEKRTRERRLKIRDQDLKEHIMKALVDGAHGMFRWVSCQMDYLSECSTDKARREALQKLPRDLPSSYERILDRVNESTKENQDLVRNVLYWIVHAEAPMSTIQMLQALATNDQEDNFDSHAMTTEDELLSWCSSLVRRNIAGDGLELAHFTVKEFLLQLEPNGEPARLYYRISDDHSVLAKSCINFFRCQTFDGQPAPRIELDKYKEATEWDLFQEKYPFSIYASQFLIHHVHASEWAHIDECVMALFDPKCDSIFNFWSSAVQYGLVSHMMRQHYDDLLDPDPSSAPGPLHIAAFYALGKVCTKLIQTGFNINEQSYLGNPFNCALRSYHVYKKGPSLHFDVEFFLPLTSARREVLRLLADAGADANNALGPEAAPQIKFLIEIHYNSGGWDAKDSFTELMGILFLGGARISVTILDYIAPQDPEFHGGWESMGEEYFCMDSIFKLVVAANGTNLMPNSTPHFLKLFLQAMAYGCNIIAWEPASKLSPGLFSVSEIEELRSKESCTSKEKEGALFKMLCSAIIRTSGAPYELKTLWNEVFCEFVAYGPTLAFVSLLEFGPKIYLYYLDDSGHNYLQLVVRSSGFLPTIRLLLDCGVSATQISDQGISAIEYAASHGYLEIFQLLWSSVKGHSGLEHSLSCMSGLSCSLIQRCFCNAVYHHHHSTAEYLQRECHGIDILCERSILLAVDQTGLLTDYGKNGKARRRSKIVDWFQAEHFTVPKIETQTSGLLDDEKSTHGEDADASLSFESIDRKALPIVAGPQVPVARFKEMVEAGFFPTRGVLSIATLLPLLLENGSTNATRKLRILLKTNPEAWKWTMQ